MSQTILQGDCMAVLPSLPADHFHCVVTSPPYFALRSYLDADHPDKGKEIGSEPTPEAFIATMVDVFRLVRRVMHPSGLLFVNLGDSYDSSGGHAGNGFTSQRKGRANLEAQAGSGYRGNTNQLLNIPHRVAEALRGDGWIWRQTLVWRKPSPMPESCKGWRWERCRVKVKGKWQNREGDSYADGHVSDIRNREAAEWSPCPGCPKCNPHGGYVLRKGKGRCTTGHEYVFVFSKEPIYFWDSAAFVEEAIRAGDRNNATEQHAEYKMHRCITVGPTRNPRSVWTISPEPTSEKHFAAFPTELARRCLQAGTSDGGCCPECGMPWAPVVESERVATRPAHKSKTYVDPEGSPYEMHSGQIIGNRDPQRHCTTSKILAYRPTCEHDLPRVPCRVCDPFAGTGTVAQVAQWMDRDSTSVELNPEYVAMIHKRMKEEPACARKAERNVTTDTPPDAPLFDAAP